MRRPKVFVCVHFLFISVPFRLFFFLPCHALTSKRTRVPMRITSLFPRSSLSFSHLWRRCVITEPNCTVCGSISFSLVFFSYLLLAPFVPVVYRVRVYLYVYMKKIRYTTPAVVNSRLGDPLLAFFLNFTPLLFRGSFQLCYFFFMVKDKREKKEKKILPLLRQVFILIKKV